MNSSTSSGDFASRLRHHRWQEDPHRAAVWWFVCPTPFVFSLSARMTPADELRWSEVLPMPTTAREMTTAVHTRGLNHSTMREQQRAIKERGEGTETSSLALVLFYVACLEASLLVLPILAFLLVRIFASLRRRPFFAPEFLSMTGAFVTTTPNFRFSSFDDCFSTPHCFFHCNCRVAFLFHLHYLFRGVNQHRSVCVVPTSICLSLRTTAAHVDAPKANHER